jgi:hypothetical protein
MKTAIRGSFVDVSNIGKEIDKYIYEYGGNPNYIVMSSSTLSMTEAIISNAISRSIEKYTEFHGVPIAICNKLRIGEFEIV